MEIIAFASLWPFLMMSHSSQAAISNNRNVPLIENVDRVCYGDLGCLVTDEDWYDKIHRPFNPTPSAREDIRTTFKLFSQDNAQGEVLHVKPGGAITSRFFDPSKDTKIIIHGFHSDSNQDWVMNITNSLIERIHVNVITVDWSNGAGSPYFRAVSNARVVGLELAFLINSLIGNYGAKARKFHLIGHSLGAHIAGYSGEKIEKLGRITGLDPAGPGFTRMPDYVRLDRNDAKFVDVIHTDAEFWGYGTEESIGDVDFFPNGGNRQPGCDLSSIHHDNGSLSLWNWLENLSSCSHARSGELFLESIISSPFLNTEVQVDHRCPLVGFLCDSYGDFVNGKCTDCGDDRSKCSFMGIDAEKYPGKKKPMTPKKFFLLTKSYSPFCGYHYALNVTVSPKPGGREQVVGEISATIHGDSGTVTGLRFMQSRSMYKGETHSFLGFTNSSAGHVNSVEFTWNWSPNSILKYLCLTCTKDLILSSLSITNMGIYSRHFLEESVACNDNATVDLKAGTPTLISLSC